MISAESELEKSQRQRIEIWNCEIMITITSHNGYFLCLNMCETLAHDNLFIITRCISNHSNNVLNYY